MLQSRNLSAVLAQPIQYSASSGLSSSSNSIVSSILISLNGQPIASSHSGKAPPLSYSAPSTLFDNASIQDPECESLNPYRRKTARTGSVSSGASSSAEILNNGSLKEQPYNISRAMKTKIYALFASSAWKEYQQANINCEETKSTSLGSKNGQSSAQNEWIAVKTKNATSILIKPVNLKSTESKLLLVLIADEECPLGFMLKKLHETVDVLEEGLDKYRVIV